MNDDSKARQVTIGDEVSSSDAADEKAQAKKKRPHGVMEGEDLELNAPETTVSGQMELNPHFSVEQARAAAKKEYNRRNSARSRVRSKKMVSQLQEECARLSKREEELVRENDALRTQLEFYRRKAGESSDLKPASLQPTRLNDTFLLQELLRGRNLSVPSSLQRPIQSQLLMGQVGGGSHSLPTARQDAISLVPTRDGSNNSFGSVARAPQPREQQQQQQQQRQPQQGLGQHRQFPWDTLGQPRASLSSVSSVAQLSPRTRALMVAMLEEKDKQTRNT